MPGPLKGVKILDLSWVLSGPLATMVLGDLGAEVIKLERPEVGDLARGNGPFIDGESSYFLSLNRGKKSLTIDLQTSRGKQLFLELTKTVDAVVENFVPGTMKRLGLDYEAVEKENPGIIYASISGFGQTGPFAQTRALDVIIQAMGGIMSITGESDGPPLRPGASLGDITAGLFAAIGIVSALFERQQSGRGQMLDISMLDCQVAILENAFSRFFATGEVPARLGTKHPVFTPFQAFESRDGYIVIAMVGGVRNQWPLFCAIIGRLDLMDDDRYQTGELRTKHYDELEPILNEIMKTKTTEQWIKELTGIGIPCGPINNIEQVASHPQVRAREMIVEVPHPKLGSVKLINSPIKLSRTPANVDRIASGLGQDTRDLLAGLLKMNESEIDKLAEDKVI
ncbi:MAG: CaiB/BaiF CoA-transferase family protein [Dehalococcoidales bacterium]|nr:CaiB/BaiF CoA-transferase family protein [Dehalococcoidales bacterium]